MLFVLMDYLERGIILERERVEKNQLTYRRKSWNRNFDYSFLNSRRTSATIPIQSIGQKNWKENFPSRTTRSRFKYDTRYM